MKALRPSGLFDADKEGSALARFVGYDRLSHTQLHCHKKKSCLKLLARFKNHHTQSRKYFETILGIDFQIPGFA